MSEEILRIEKQICRLATRLDDLLMQVRDTRGRLTDIVEQVRLNSQRIERIGMVSQEVIDHPALSMPPINLSYVTAQSTTTGYSTTIPFIDPQRTFVYNDHGVCVSETHGTRKVPGAAPIGKES